MQIRVLGPLQVEEKGNSHALGGPKQRTLLALLIAAHGDPVSSDALVMGVYGADADPKRLRSIQTYISTFRRSIGEIIERTGDGYRLKIDPETVDAHRFEAAIRRARVTLNTARSAEILTECLRLWRGRPYSDVGDSEGIRAEIRRLEELHAEALEALIDIDLGAGKHRQLLAKLEELVATYPAREGLRSRQMLALYRSGRQTDALEAYRTAEQHLRDEHGLETSKEIRQLERNILNQDDTLDYRPEPIARVEPSRYTSFIGRDTETIEAIELLAAHRLVTITGPGGVGKSSLAAQIARSLAEDVATVYVPIEAQRAANPLDVVARSLGLAPKNDSDVAAMITKALDGRQSMILLDGCEHLIDELPKVVDDLLARNPKTRVLVTSREPLSIPGEHVFELGPLDRGAGSSSNDLFIDRARLEASTLTESETTAITAICERLSGLPLAIELAAPRWSSLTPEAIVGQLDNQTALLSTRRNTRDRHSSIVAALDWTYTMLAPPLQRAFRSLSVFLNDVPIDGAAHILGVDDPSELLQELAHVSMLSGNAGAGYTMLEPVRQYAWMHLQESSEADAVRLRHATWIVDVCAGIHDGFEFERSSPFRQLRDNGPQIAAAAAWALEADKPDIVFAIVAHVGRYWSRTLEPDLLRFTANAALDHPDAPTNGLAKQALAYSALIQCEADPETAQSLHHRLEAQISVDDDPGTRRVALQMLGMLPYTVEGLNPLGYVEGLDRWLTLWDEGTEVGTDLGYPSQPNLYFRSILLGDLGRIDESQADADALLEWADATRPNDRGKGLLRLALLTYRTGRYSDIIAMTREATRLFLEAGNLDMAAEGHYLGSFAHFFVARYDKALEAVAMGDELHELIGLPPALVEEPVQVAMFSAALSLWDETAESLSLFVDQVATIDDPLARSAILKGYGVLGGSDLVRAMYPAARLLIFEGRHEEAAAIVAAAPTALALSGAIRAEVEAVLGLTDELAGYRAADHPETLEDLFGFIADRFSRPETTIASPRAGTATRDPTDQEVRRRHAGRGSRA